MAKEYKPSKQVYLMFCEKCGSPKHIPINILETTILNPAVPGIYCEICDFNNLISDYLRKHTIDLLKGDKNYND